MVVVNKADELKIKEVLSDCKQTLTKLVFFLFFIFVSDWSDLNISIFSEGFFDAPLNVRMEGLEYMNDDPHSVDVLYAKVDLDDESDRLISFHL